MCQILKKSNSNYTRNPYYMEKQLLIHFHVLNKAMPAHKYSSGIVFNQYFSCDITRCLIVLYEEQIPC